MKSSSSVWNVESVVLKQLQVLQVSAQLTCTFANFLKTVEAASQYLLTLVHTQLEWHMAFEESACRLSALSVASGCAVDFGAYMLH